MKSVIVLLLIMVFVLVGWLLITWMQKIIKPRKSFGRLILYFFTALLLVFVLSFLMVTLIARIYPDQLIK